MLNTLIYSLFSFGCLPKCAEAMHAYLYFSANEPQSVKVTSGLM